MLTHEHAAVTPMPQLKDVYFPGNLPIQCVYWLDTHWTRRVPGKYTSLRWGMGVTAACLCVSTKRLGCASPRHTQPALTAAAPNNAS